jgi:hypothetical protein
MPLVFVHGVSNRDDRPEYRDNLLARDDFLRVHVIPRLGLQPHKVPLLNPYWGDHGVKFRWGNASLAETFDSMETFGTGLDQLNLRFGADIVALFGPGAADIVSVARGPSTPINNPLEEAVDIVWGAALPIAESTDQSVMLAESCRAAFDYAAANPTPDWLASANNDNFVDLLLEHIEHYEEARAPSAVHDEVQWESFGGGARLLEYLQEGVSRITGVVPSVMSTAITSLGRKKIHLGASMFVGDVFEYLTKRGDRENPGPIPATVLDAFRSARAQICVEDPQLIVIGHSLGGVISYDILTHFDPALEVDLFVTVGSQVALFEEMNLYKHGASPANAPVERLDRPANIRRWLNVLDPNDWFGFRAEGVYSGVTDFKYETGYGLMQAHSGYFQRPSFYRRLGERLAQLTA